MSGAAARGVNLHAAFDVIHLGLTSGATMRQRVGRAVGSTRDKVTVHVPTLSGSIDDLLYPALLPVPADLDRPSPRGSPVDVASDEGLTNLLTALIS